MSYQNRWRDALIYMMMTAAAAYFFDLRDLWRQHDDLENELQRAEVRASIQHVETTVPQKIEAPYLALLTRLLDEHHVQLIGISSTDDDHFQLKISGSYAGMRQFISMLSANSELIIHDILFVSDSEMDAKMDLNVTFTNGSAAKNFSEKLPATQYNNPFCSALNRKKISSFRRDEISFFGTVSRGSQTHSVVMYPNGVMAEINK